MTHWIFTSASRDDTNVKLKHFISHSISNIFQQTNDQSKALNEICPFLASKHEKKRAVMVCAFCPTFTKQCLVVSSIRLCLRSRLTLRSVEQRCTLVWSTLQQSLLEQTSDATGCHRRSQASWSDASFGSGVASDHSSARLCCFFHLVLVNRRVWKCGRQQEVWRSGCCCGSQVRFWKARDLMPR